MNHGQESQGRIISIHAPQWGATIWFRWSNWITRISIHAPQWGATYLAVAVVVEQSISIHAPQWGATGAWRVHAQRGGISIHAPQWGATVEIRTAAMAHPISIHAPQWGATRWCPSRRRTGRNFNPRTPVGCDPVGYVLSHSMGIFQSTHPSGVRQPCALIHLTAISYFNPRTPVGCDILRS